MKNCNFKIIKNISRTAMPICISSALSFCSALINIRNVGIASPSALIIFALSMPINYLILAAYEATRATMVAMVPSTINCTRMMKYLHGLLLVTVIFFLGVGLVVHVSQQIAEFKFSETENLYLYIYSMLIVGIFNVWSVALCNYLYCLRYNMESMLLLVVSSIANIILTYLFVNQLQFSIYSITISSFLCSLLVILLAYQKISSIYKIQWRNCLPDKSVISLVIKQLKVTGMPVLISYLVMFVGIYCFNKIIFKQNPLVVAGFSMAYRFQSILMLPAIAIGIASSIQFNEKLKSKNIIESYELFRYAILISIILYVCIAILTTIFKSTIVALLISNTEIQQNALSYLNYISPSLVGLGPLITTLILIEQTGLGILGIIFNLSYFLVSVGFAEMMLNNNLSIHLFYSLLANINYCFLIIILLFYIFRNHSYLLFLKSYSTIIKRW